MAKNSEFNIYAYSLEIGFRISIPLVFFVVIGVWADNKFGTGHSLLLGGITLSLFTSAYGIKKTLDKFKDL